MSRVDPINRLLSQIPLAIIKVYRYGLSPLFVNHCRFTPSCSLYAQECYQRFGFIKGSVLTIKRLLKCHPWHKAGYDPVPEIDKKKLKN